MSARRNARRTRMGAALVRLYPEPWRERYGEEMRSLLEDDPPTLAGLGTLVLGALDAHVRPRSWREKLDPATLMRLSVSGLFFCWIGLSLSGLGFQKDTEGADFLHTASADRLLWLAHEAVVAGAALGAASIAFGGLPLLWRALVRARQDRRLALLVALPPLAVAGWVAVTLALMVIAPARGNGFPAGFVAGIMAPWTLAIVACASVCAFVPRVVLRRLRPPAASLRRASLAGMALALAMCIVAAGMIVYAVALIGAHPHLAGEETGPWGASTAAMLIAQALTAAVWAELGAVAAWRARAAAR